MREVGFVACEKCRAAYERVAQLSEQKTTLIGNLERKLAVAESALGEARAAITRITGTNDVASVIAEAMDFLDVYVKKLKDDLELARAAFAKIASCAGRRGNEAPE